MLAPMARALIPTGIAIALPPGFEAQIRRAAGFSKQGLTLLNSPGTIDSTTAARIQVIAINLGNESILIQRGQRIAQNDRAARRSRPVALEVDDLSLSARQDGGFGHTDEKRGAINRALHSRCRTSQHDPRVTPGLEMGHIWSKKMVFKNGSRSKFLLPRVWRASGKFPKPPSRAFAGKRALM
mgnify:CR=1 FL=1